MQTFRERRSVSIIIGFIVSLGLIVLPFLSNGVFFPTGQFSLDIILGVILTAISALSVFNPKFKTWLLQDERLTLVDFALLFLVFLYVIALFYAASLNLAVGGALNYIALLLPYMVFRFRALRNFMSVWVGIGFALASGVVDIIGLANGWNQLHFPSATETTPQGKIEISSVFQYHNAFAAFTASIAIGLLVWCARSSCGWVKRSIALSLAGLNVLALLASGSRGALAIWIMVMILTAIGMRDASDNALHARNRFIGCAYIALVGGLIGYELSNHGIKHNSPVFGWSGVALAILVPFLLGYLRHLTKSRLEKPSPRNGLWYLIGIGVLLAIVGGVAKHHSIAQKLASYQVHQMSVSQRFIFWRDGLHILASNPISGRGAGAWQAMYMRIQSYPYYSNKAHSFGIDTLIEAGVLGAICLIFIVWPMFRQTIWPSKNSLNQMTPVQVAFISGSLMLFCHSLMDWDMSFEYLLLLFFAGVGAAAGESSVVIRNLSVLRSQRFAVVAGGIVGIGALITSLVSLGGLVATRSVIGVSKESPEAASQTYLAAYHLAPYDGDYLAQAAIALLQSGQAVANQKTAEALIEHAERLDRYSASTAATYAQLAYNLGNFKGAYKQAELAATNAPYWPANVSLALTAGTVAGLQEASTNPAYTKQTFEDVVALYQKALGYQKTVQALPSYLPPAVPYTLNSFSLVSVAAAEYALGDSTDAASLAAGELNDPDQHTRDVAKMILLLVQRPSMVASYVKSHSDVVASYELLIRSKRQLTH